MAKTKNTAEPMDETPEVLEEITPEIREEIPFDPDLVERPEITEDPDGPRTLDSESEQLRTADDSDVSPLADIDPATRIEFFLDEIATGLAELVPATRIEEFLHRIAVRLNTIYNYEPVIPDVSNADKDKVMTVIASTSDDPAKWAPVYPMMIPGTGDDSYKTHYSDNTSSGTRAIAIGRGNVASGQSSLAIGDMATGASVGNQSTGRNSIAIGETNNSSGTVAFCLGSRNTASATLSAAIGGRLTATGRASTVIGQSNVADDNPEDSSHGSGARKYIFIIGNGSFDGATKSNALTVDWNGNVVASGAVTATNIPAPPSGLGNYYLQVNVDADGVPTYSWTAV